MNFLAEQKKWEQEHPEETKKMREAEFRRDLLFFGAVALVYFIVAVFYAIRNSYER